MKKLILFFIAMICILPINAQEVTVGLLLEKGKVYHQIVESKNAMVQEFSGQKVDVQMSTKYSVSFLVKEILNGSYHMEASFSKMSITMTMPQNTLEFSSEKKDVNDIISNILGGMVNKPFEVYISNTGQVTSVVGIEANYTSVIAQLNTITVAQSEQIKPHIIRSFGDGVFRGNLSSVTSVLPGKSVKVGDKWAGRTRRLLMSSTMVGRSEVELSEIGSTYIVLKNKGTMVTRDKNELVASYGRPMKYDLTGTYSSLIKIDKATGWVVNAKVSHEVAGNATIEKSTELPAGMVVPVTIKGDLIYTE